MKTILFKNTETGIIHTFTEVKEMYAEKNQSDLPIDNDSFMIIILTSLLTRHGGNLELINDDILAWCNDYAESVEAARYLSKEETENSIRDIYIYIANYNTSFLKMVKENIKEDEALCTRLEQLVKEVVEVNLAKALVFIDSENNDMGSSYSESVEFYCEGADIGFNDKEDLYEQAYKAYKKLVAVKPSIIIDHLDIFFNGDYYYIQTLKENLKNHKEIHYEKHPTIKALKSVLSYLKYAEEFGLYDGHLTSKATEVMREFDFIDLEVIRIGALFGDTYYKHLDTECFGVVTNCCFKVGCVVMDDHPLGDKYIYQAHAEYNRLNTPYNGYGIFFKRDEKGAVFADVYFYTRASGNSSLDYQNIVFSEAVNINNVEEKSLLIAQKINSLAGENLKINEDPTLEYDPALEINRVVVVKSKEEECGEEYFKVYVPGGVSEEKLEEIFAMAVKYVELNMRENYEDFDAAEYDPLLDNMITFIKNGNNGQSVFNHYIQLCGLEIVPLEHHFSYEW